MIMEIRPKKSIRTKAITVFALVAIVIFSVFLAVDSLISKPMLTVAQEQAKRTANELLTKAVLSVAEEYAQEDAGAMAVCSADSQGRSILYIDSQKLTLEAMRIIDAAQKELGILNEIGISLSLGTASRIPLLSGRGPKLKAMIEPLGAVSGRITSSFSSAGVNQTKYSAFIELKAELKVIFAGRERIVTVSSAAPVFETIIIGDVPDAYTDVNSMNDALNLIPADAD